MGMEKAVAESGRLLPTNPKALKQIICEPSRIQKENAEIGIVGR